MKLSLITVHLGLLCVWALAIIAPAQAASYYLDSNVGDDNASGTDSLTPWKSLEKANKTPLQPGDKLLFARGGVWGGQLSIHDAGTDGNPIYVGAYGDEAKPKPTIHGDGLVTAAIFIKNSASYLTVENFAVTNFDGQDIFDGAEANRCGIKVGEWGGTQNQIKILHNEMYFVESCSNHPKIGSPRGTTLDPRNNHQYAAAALFVNPTQMTDILIDGNEVHDCTGTAIMVFGAKDISGLLIQNNRIDNVGSDGIEILNATKPVVQSNSCIKAGNNSGTEERGPGVLGYHGLAVCGMWATGSSDVLFQYNYCEGTRQIKYDGQAWDFDNRLTGTCIYQYNFSRDNEGGFLLSNMEKKPGYTRICRFNISVNDGGKQGAGEGFFNNIADYENNIFYRTDGKGFLVPDSKLSSKMSGNFKNNIFYTTASTDIAYQTPTRTFTNNCFYGHTPTDPGTDAVLDDPQFVDVAAATAAHSLKDVAGFQLKIGSPCVGKGIMTSDNGGKDFWGNPLATDKMDIGANAYK